MNSHREHREIIHSLCVLRRPAVANNLHPFENRYKNHEETKTTKKKEG